MKKIFIDNFDPIKSNELFGHSILFKNLATFCENRKVPKVIMLSGEKGLGKFTLALHFINYFFTLKDTQFRYDLKKQYIDKNNPFYKKILNNINENFIYLANNDVRSISIDDIRSLKKKFSSSSLNSLPRFTILDDAEKLNKSSANSLLKLIEEPTQLNYFVLINNQRGKIIETLKSRSIEFKIFLKASEKINIFKKLLVKHDLENSVNPEIISKTSPGLLIRIIENMKQNSIEIENSFFENTETLLDKYKKDKNHILIDTVKFLFEINIYSKLTDRSINFIKINFLKNKINKLLYNFENFNLSKNLVLENLKNLDV
tara:strand:- start:4788 stop:5738 length:951 start_codon:yes stop_codon:yes gene_type:complete